MSERPFFAHPELPLPDPTLSVFINCPYDDDYEPLLDAIVFTTVCCGFQPRTADESSDTDVPRMDRILHAVFTSNYSIHDLSRCKGEGEELLARFNMPLELGLAVGRRFVGAAFSSRASSAAKKKTGAEAVGFDREIAELARRHRWLVLVLEEIRYPKYISDLAGFDLQTYDGKIGSIVQRVMAWLMTREGAVPGMSPRLVQKAFPRFMQQKLELNNEWGRVPWRLILQAARNCVPKL